MSETHLRDPGLSRRSCSSPLRLVRRRRRPPAGWADAGASRVAVGGAVRSARAEARSAPMPSAAPVATVVAPAPGPAANAQLRDPDLDRERRGHHEPGSDEVRRRHRRPADPEDVPDRRLRHPQRQPARRLRHDDVAARRRAARRHVVPGDDLGRPGAAPESTVESRYAFEVPAGTAFEDVVLRFEDPVREPSVDLPLSGAAPAVEADETTKVGRTVRSASRASRCTGPSIR